jgi:hypothetical protein
LSRERQSRGFGMDKTEVEPNTLFTSFSNLEEGSSVRKQEAGKEQNTNNSLSPNSLVLKVDWLSSLSANLRI